MRDRIKQIAHLNLDTKFFAQLSRQAKLKGLSSLPFTTRKLPQSGQMGMITSLGNQHLPFAKDKGRSNVDDFHGVSRFGHAYDVLVAYLQAIADVNGQYFCRQIPAVPFPADQTGCGHQKG